ncbi:MAG: methyltransferase domain-containing protein [Bacteroidales bacterium]|nr:methyltransferase domain-containing protein [Bacteroidales bacterium]
MDVENFYNLISSNYTEMLARLVPRYREMLWMILTYIPKDLHPNRIVDLGCGTGNLSKGILNQYPQAEVLAVDLSASILDEASKRLSNYTTISYINQDFNHLDFEENSIDLVVSSIALHHLTDLQKEKLLKKIYRWLSPKGVLIFGDQFSGSTSDRYEQHMENWKLTSEGKNVPESEWALWMEHQKNHDYHTSVENYFNWCKQIGYKNSDVVWRYYLWTVFIAHKTQ